MQENPFNDQVSSIVATLSCIFKAQERKEYVKILDAASPAIEETEYDNWNGGTYYYTLFLEVSVEIFAMIESALSKHESEIAAKLQAVVRENGNHILNRVVIRPQLVEPAGSVAPSHSESERAQVVWAGKPIKVFISHQHADKVAASNLKTVLSKFNIAGFVAHEDIEPTLPWQSEIKIALNTMDVFVAFLTSNFRNSKWTDQEVGFAVAKKTLIIHIRDGQDPYGFIGETQSLSLPIDQDEKLGMEIATILLKNPTLKSKVRETLFVALENINSHNFACKIMKLLQKAGVITESEIQRIRDAASNNSWVKGAFTIKNFLAANPPLNEVPF
ncbi:MAG: toll/interleukin-1 receptor domain-containing protein [Elusimicrobia bacterium]|nr:toll/interleukin-1 receptor domain-containing protein [Elusimicrobiota bacterium]